MDDEVETERLAATDRGRYEHGYAGPTMQWIAAESLGGEWPDERPGRRSEVMA